MSVPASFTPGKNSLNASINARKTTGSNPKNQGFGNLVGEILGFDPTPGFNIPNPFHKTSAPSKSTPAKKTNANAPNETQYNPSSNSGGGSSTTTEYSPSDVAMIDAGIANANNGIGLLDKQQSVGLGNIGNSFNASLNKLMSSKATADRNYNTNKTQATEDNIKARSEITSDVGRNANALKRLLGQHGAGNSSAAQIVAPYGAALEGTKQLRGVADTFGKNMQELDTNYQDFNNSWKDSRDDIDQQRFAQENSLKSTVADKRSQLLQTLATLSAQRTAAKGGNSAAALAAAMPFINQANTASAEATNLGAQFAAPITVNTPTYTAPELADYNYDESSVQTPTANTSALTDTISPYLALLLGKNKQNSLAAA